MWQWQDVEWSVGLALASATCSSCAVWIYSHTHSLTHSLTYSITRSLVTLKYSHTHTHTHTHPLNHTSRIVSSWLKWKEINLTCGLVRVRNCNNATTQAAAGKWTASQFRIQINLNLTNKAEELSYCWLTVDRLTTARNNNKTNTTNKTNKTNNKTNNTTNNTTDTTNKTNKTPTTRPRRARLLDFRPFN